MNGWVAALVLWLGLSMWELEGCLFLVLFAGKGLCHSWCFLVLEVCCLVISGYYDVPCTQVWRPGLECCYVSNSKFKVHLPSSPDCYARGFMLFQPVPCYVWYAV